MENLRYIVAKTGARIVLSSDWRRHREARNEVKRVLAHYGMEFIACTPQHGSPYSLNRATEVLTWVEDHNRRCREECRDVSEMVEAFVAIDDRPLIHEVEGAGMVGHFVMTHIRRGLTRPACEAAIKCLETLQHIPEVLLNADIKAAVQSGRVPVRATNTSAGYAAGSGSGNGPGHQSAAGAAAAVAHAVNNSRESSAAAANGSAHYGGGGGAGGSPTKPLRISLATSTGGSGSSTPPTPTSPSSPRTLSGGGGGSSPISSPSARALAARYQGSQTSLQTVSAGYEMTTRGLRAPMAPRTPAGKYAGGGGGGMSPSSLNSRERGGPLASMHAMRDSLPSLSMHGPGAASVPSTPKSPMRGGLICAGTGVGGGSTAGGVPLSLGARSATSTPGQRNILRARSTGVGTGVSPPTLAMSKTISKTGGRFASDSPPRGNTGGGIRMR